MNRMRLLTRAPTALAVPLLMLLLSVSTARGGSYRWYCSLSSEPVVDVVWSSKEQSYVIWDGNYTDTDVGAQVAPSNQGGRRERELRDNDLVEDEDDDSLSTSFLRRLGGSTTRANFETALSVSRQAQEGNLSSTVVIEEGDMQVIRVRRCPCWNSVPSQDKDFFCPVSRTHCGLATGYSASSAPAELQSSAYQNPGCLDVSKQKTFARNVWPVISVWYLAMFICLLLTRPGKHAIGYCISHIYPNWNVQTTHRIIHTHPDYTNRVVLNHMAANATTASRNNINSNSNSNNNDNSSNNRITHSGFEITFESIPRGGDDGDNNTRIGTLHRGSELLLHTKTYHYGTKTTKGDTTTTTTTTTTEKAKEGDTSDSSIEDAKPEPSSDSERGADKSATHQGLDVTIEGNTQWDGGCGDDETLVACTICHVDIENGDRVGDLPCGHIMHIECLKTWIPRRNVCPLCLAENIATPRNSAANGLIVRDHSMQQR